MWKTLQIGAGVLLTSVICCWTWVYFQPNIPTETGQLTSQPEAHYQAGGSECLPRAVAAISDAVARQIKADDCAIQRDDERQEQADLVQQTRAANAGSVVAALTENQSRIALLSAILSLITTALLVWTLWQTRSASRQQLRAYVMPHTFDVQHRANLKPSERGKVPHRFGLIIGIKNGGQTPAWNLRHVGELKIAPPDTEEEMSISGPLERRSTLVLSAGGIATKTLNPFPLLTDEQEARISSGEEVAFLYGKIEYRDVFGRNRETSYRLKYIGPWPPRGAATMTFCDNGNDAT